MHCHRKIKYLDVRTAESMIRRLKRPCNVTRRIVDEYGDPGLLEVYKCRTCSFYHVGHRRHDSCYEMMNEEKRPAMA